MSGIILVEVFNEKELKDIVVNNGVDVNWFYKTDVNFHGNGIVVWLGENSWSYSTVDYLKEENVKYSDVISYETYMNKYGVFNHKSQPEEDMVNHPSHYKQFDRETIDTMKGMSTPEEFRGHLKLTAVKYISRYQGKNGIQDIEKAIWYMERLKKELIDEQSNTTN